MSQVSQRPLKVLLVEDRHEVDGDFLGALSTVESPPIDLERAPQLSDALKRLSQGGIDLVLLDLDLPDSQGQVTFERAYAFAPDVPIIVITDRRGGDLAVSTVQGGAQDFLLRDEVEIPAVVRSIQYAVERHRLLSALRSLSLIDDHTGLYNRTGFFDLGERNLKLARRMGRDVALIYLDIDRFKTINDTLGHHVGDRTLIKVTEMLRVSFRRSDILARMDGDEFAVLAPEASGENLEVMVERLRSRVQEFNETSREAYQLSVSIGAARYAADSPISLEELLERAEEEVEREKREKRRTVTPRSSRSAGFAANPVPETPEGEAEA